MFEVKLKAKVDCFLDASRYCGSEKIIALDAGAYIIRPINELFAQTGNVVLGKVPDNVVNTEYNYLRLINTGVVVFSADQARRTRFLQWWKDLTEKSVEAWGDQSALARALWDQAPNLFDGRDRIDVAVGETVFDVAVYDCLRFNNQYLNEISAASLEKVRIVHFVDRKKDRYLETLADIDRCLSIKTA